jgi:hypothetical protein
MIEPFQRVQVSNGVVLSGGEKGEKEVGEGE